MLGCGSLLVAVLSPRPMPVRRPPRTGRRSSWSPGCSWSGWWPTRTASSPPAATRWLDCPQRRRPLRGHGRPRRRGHHAAQPRHVGHLPDAGPRLRRPQPGRGRGPAALRLPAALERRLAAASRVQPHQPDRARPPPPLGGCLLRHMALAGARGRRGHRRGRRRRPPPCAAHHDRADHRARTPGARCRARGASRPSPCSWWRSARRPCRWPPSASARWQIRRGGGPARHAPGAALRILGLPVLVGLFGLAVALGTLGRSWSGPATLLSHLDAWGTAAPRRSSACWSTTCPPPRSWRPAGRPIPSPCWSGSTSAQHVRDGIAGLDPVAAGGRAGRAARHRAGQPARPGQAPLAIAAAVGVLVLQGLR